jgi:hypothetical protein
MHNLMFATARWKVAKLRGLRDQGTGPLPHSPGNRTPGPRAGSGSGGPRRYPGHRWFQGQARDRLLPCDAGNNESCGRRALNDEGWRLRQIAAQSSRHGRRVERLNGSSTVSSTSTKVRVQSLLHHPTVAYVDARVVEVRPSPRAWPILAHGVRDGVR